MLLSCHLTKQNLVLTAAQMQPIRSKKTMDIYGIGAVFVTSSKGNTKNMVLVDVRIEHVEESEDGSLLLDIKDGAGEIKQLYFTEIQAVKDFVDDIKLVLTGELNNGKSNDGNPPTGEEGSNSLYAGTSIH
jgi:hypothetical protein